MKIYISMLRGINVSGQKKIQMIDLKALYEALKFKDVTTYIQSGNIIFKANEKIFDENLAIKIEEAIYKKYNFNTFLAENPPQANVESIKHIDYSPDKFIITGKEIYLYCPNGYGITKLSNNFFENKLKVKATTRNWKTVNKFVELAASD